MSFFYQLLVVDSQKFPKLPTPQEKMVHMSFSVRESQRNACTQCCASINKSTNQQTESWDETYHIMISYVRLFPSSKSNQISGITWISCRSSVPPTSWPMTTVAMALAKALPPRKPATSPSRPLWERKWLGGTFGDAKNG